MTGCSAEFETVRLSVRPARSAAFRGSLKHRDQVDTTHLGGEYFIRNFPALPGA